MGLNITIGVGGRFHSDHLGAALREAGHSVRIITSFPRSRFPENIQSEVHPHLLGELVFRLGRTIGMESWASHWKMGEFGRHLARQVQKQKPDLLIAWSSFALEAFKQRSAGRQILIRDSNHIEDQMEVLANEYRRWGLSFQINSQTIARELAEYQLADEILVLSEQAKQSFVLRGTSERKVRILRLGVDTARFKPHPQALDLSPVLRVVYFGSLSLRKGIPYLAEAIRLLGDRPVEFHLIGHLEVGLEKMVNSSLPNTHIHPAMPQAKLAEFLSGMDLFVFPTLEDGFGQTLIQAMAAGVVPIVSDRCGAKDLVEDGKEAVIIPARNSMAIVEAISSLLNAPEKIGEMRERGLQRARQITWDYYRRQVEEIFPKGLAPTQYPTATTHSPA